MLLVRRRRAQAVSGIVGRALGFSSLGFAVAGLVAPGRVGEWMKLDRSTVWALAVRDLVSAWLLLGGAGPAALLSRALFDMGDAVMMIRRRPALAAVAAAAGVVALGGGLAERD